MGGFKEILTGIEEAIARLEVLCRLASTEEIEDLRGEDERTIVSTVGVCVDGMTVGESFVLKWQYDLHGHFFSALVNAIRYADTTNRSRLMMGFPQEVEAMNNYWFTEGWWDELDRKARIQEWGPFKSVQCTKENEDEE